MTKTLPDNRQHRLGPRSAETEQLLGEFTSKKRDVEARLKSLRQALTDAERMNKALKAGRTPNLVTTLLQTLEDAGLGQHFTVVGTHALYAYETAAGVRIDRGFEVDFLRRIATGDDPHPFRLSDDEGDLWPVQARRASVPTDAPRFEHLVIWATGHMALMRTVAPQSFVEFKRWLATQAPDRPQAKRRRDLRQAEIFQSLLDEGVLISSTRQWHPHFAQGHESG